MYTLVGKYRYFEVNFRSLRAPALGLCLISMSNIYICLYIIDVFLILQEKPAKSLLFCLTKQLFLWTFEAILATDFIKGLRYFHRVKVA
jgi:hypothetical protein